ncbi:UDP-N-acetylglucosamine 1-carboxyvinyltransferase, partial [bacterium]|nr:UDP-N-acetylglucosamine 1-carboxyvinyltransferase [bacterium]
MEYFEIHGGVPLEGEIKVFAAKNSVLPMMAAAVLAGSGTTRINNVPDIADVRTMAEVLRRLGAEIEFDKQNNVLWINTENIRSYEAPYDLVSRMRASFLVMGPLLARFGTARVSQPGGCA